MNGKTEELYLGTEEVTDLLRELFTEIGLYRIVRESEDGFTCEVPLEDFGDCHNAFLRVRIGIRELNGELLLSLDGPRFHATVDDGPDIVDARIVDKVSELGRPVAVLAETEKLLTILKSSSGNEVFFDPEVRECILDLACTDEVHLVFRSLVDRIPGARFVRYDHVIGIPL